MEASIFFFKIHRAVKILFSGGGSQRRLSRLAVNKSGVRCGETIFFAINRKKYIFCCSWIESSPSLPGPVGGVGCCTLIKEEKSKRKWDVDVVKKGWKFLLSGSFSLEREGFNNNKNVEHLHFYFPKKHISFSSFLFVPLPLHLPLWLNKAPCRAEPQSRPLIRPRPLARRFHE